MKKLKNETGRSMVEMLGVLAIIGVLSVAGIAGYTSAMRQYRANEIVNAISTLYVMGMAQNQGNGDQELPYTSIGTNPSSATLVYNNKTVTATITDDKICDMVKDKFGSKATGECSGASSTLTFTFGETTTTNGNAPVMLEHDECINKGYYYSTGFSDGNGASCFKTRNDMESLASNSQGSCSCIGDSNFPDWLLDDPDYPENPTENHDCFCYQD